MMYGERMKETSTVTIGPFTFYVDATPKGVSHLRISRKPLNKGESKNKIIIQFMKEMVKFQNGKKDAFRHLQLDTVGTAFQAKVWEAVRKIPYGETRTYSQIAAEVGSPRAVRAVGTALGKNPVCIVVPCHRVVPASGGIGQYALGKKVKQWLLDHEAARNPAVKRVRKG